jgi:hypothetical protein
LLSALLSTVGLHGSTRSSCAKLMRHFTSASPISLTLQEVITDHSFVSVKDWLIPDKDTTTPQNEPRQIYQAHYCNVMPEQCSKPYLVAASPSCIQLLNFPQNSLNDQSFVNTFSGNQLANGLDQPYALNYGCHRYLIVSYYILLYLPFSYCCLATANGLAS